MLEHDFYYSQTIINYVLNTLIYLYYVILFFSSMSFFNASVSEPMTISEELAHLRQQMGRVSRRVIELEHTASLPFYVREKKLIVTLICSYMVFKFASWITRR